MGLRGRQLISSTDHLFFVTTTVVNSIRIFQEDRFCSLLIQNIKHYQKRYQFEIYGYVIMPSHFHWIVEVDHRYGTISGIMRDLKKYSAWDIMEAVENEQRLDLLEQFRNAAAGYKNQHRKFWMDRFDDEVIHNEGMLRTKLEYIHYNPVKAGLVLNPEDYRYSSTRNYICNDHSILQVKTDWW
ncbi:MAG: transposase [bacterium]